MLGNQGTSSQESLWEWPKVTLQVSGRAGTGTHHTQLPLRGLDRIHSLPGRLWAGVGASCTFRARPKEPRYEELSRTMKAPGSSFLSSSMAGTILESETVTTPPGHPPFLSPTGSS